MVYQTLKFTVGCGLGDSHESALTFLGASLIVPWASSHWCIYTTGSLIKRCIPGMFGTWGFTFMPLQTAIASHSQTDGSTGRSYSSSALALPRRGSAGFSRLTTWPPVALR